MISIVASIGALDVGVSVVDLGLLEWLRHITRSLRIRSYITILKKTWKLYLWCFLLIGVIGITIEVSKGRTLCIIHSILLMRIQQLSCHIGWTWFTSWMLPWHSWSHIKCLQAMSSRRCFRDPSFLTCYLHDLIALNRIKKDTIIYFPLDNVLILVLYICFLLIIWCQHCLRIYNFLNGRWHWMLSFSSIMNWHIVSYSHCSCWIWIDASKVQWNSGASPHTSY